MAKKPFNFMEQVASKKSAKKTNPFGGKDKKTNPFVGKDKKKKKEKK